MRPAILAAGLILLAAPLAAQDARRAGPTIQSAGTVFEVADPSFATPVDMPFKLAFEMAAAAPEPGEMNVTLNSVARYLNMHAQAGVPATQISAAVVVHGPAGWELLDDNAYRDRHGVANPNSGVVRELLQAGVRIVLCGQTAASRGIPTEHLMSGVEVALSAMTAFLVLQEEGYRVNPW